MTENLRGYDAWKTTEPEERWEPDSDEEADDPANDDDDVEGWIDDFEDC